MGFRDWFKRTACPTIGMLRSGQTPLRTQPGWVARNAPTFKFSLFDGLNRLRKENSNLEAPTCSAYKGQNAVVRFPARFPWRGGVIYRVSLPIDGSSLRCKMGSAWFNSL